MWRTVERYRLSTISCRAAATWRRLPFPTVPERFRVLSLTNFSPNRGVDRIVDIAEILRRRGDDRFAFYLCGKPANTHAITGRVDPYYGSIVDRVRALGLDDTGVFSRSRE